VWVLIAAVLHLFGNNIGTFTILAATIVVPLISGITLFITIRFAVNGHLFSLHLPDTCTKGQEVSGKLIVNPGWLASILKISCTLVYENIFTNELSNLHIDIRKAENTFSVQTSHCGAVRIRVENFLIFDPLGLFSYKIACSIQHHIIAQPIGTVVDIPLLDNAPGLDSDEYSTSKAGMDVSETYAIREYRPGDPIRSIHWKLSEKLDKVMVREFGLPIGNSVLLVLGVSIDAEVSPAGWDATGELFYSMGLALLRESIRTTVGWQNEETGGFTIVKLHGPEDALAAMEDCFLTVAKNEMPDNFIHIGFEHIIVVTPGDTPTIKFIGA